MPTIDLTIASLRFNVYENHVSKPETRLAHVARCVRALCRNHYSTAAGKYLIITGPEYMFARKNYTLSAFGTKEFKAWDVTKAPTLKPGEKKGTMVPEDTGFDMEEGAEARRKTAYSEKEKDAIILELQSLTTNQPNLLLVPGTIMWREYLYLKKILKRLSPVFNSAPILSNGETVHLYNKKNGSDEIKADYRLRNTKFGDQAERYRFVGGTSTGRFTWRNITFGIEVCADHSSGTLKSELGQQKVDLHLMVSAGMEPMKNANCAKPGGLLISNDGSKEAKSQQVNGIEPTGLLKKLDASDQQDDWWIWKTQINI